MRDPAAELDASAFICLQSRIGYRFSDIALLRQAMIHRSYLNEFPRPGLRSNERLEFLGDAILGSVVAQTLYANFPESDEGWMTKARSRLVRNRTLAAIGRALDLDQCLVLGSSLSSNAARRHPNVLGRALEAIIGAVWLDGGDAAARDVTLRLLEEQLSALSRGDLEEDPKSQLQHLIQLDTGDQPVYTIVDSSGPLHAPRFRATVEVKGTQLGEGEGGSKQGAEREAARHALLELQAEFDL